MKIKITLTAILVAALCISASAQVPSFRDKGYKGSAGIAGFIFYGPGVETSHGYMFNPVHYLGGGIGVNSLPVGGVPLYTTEFIEYQAYILKRNSTPVFGARIGSFQQFNWDSPNISVLGLIEPIVIPTPYLCFNFEF